MEEPEVEHSFYNSVYEGSGFELNIHKLSCERPCAEDELCTSTDMTENAVNKVQHVSYFCCVIKNDNAVDEKVGVDETFNLQISHEQNAGHDPTSEVDKVANFKNISLCKELVFSDIRMQKCLIKSATFPSSEVESLNFLKPGINGSSCSSAPVQNSSSDQLLTYKRSTSLPASSKLVSAMKGGRTQNNGTSPSLDLRVKWAEDVYDPPSTSMSHTVKNHNIQRPKSKKKDNHRQKHNKGKTARGNNNTGKKSPNRGNVGTISSPFPAKLHAGGANGPAAAAAQSEDMLKFGVGGLHDIKCGSSIFLRESLAKMHLSFGEAT